MTNTSHQLQLINKIKQSNLTYLSVEKLAYLAQCCAHIEENSIPGSFIEAGCALGGSTICLASVKALNRPLIVYDVFDMIPPPGDNDGDDVHKRYSIISSGKSKGIQGDLYYGYHEDLFNTVLSNLKKFSITPHSHQVTLIKGLLQDKMHIEGQVALAHIDVDWYESVKTCLERIYPCLVSGGVMIIDDYKYWSGCRRAVDEFMAQHSENLTISLESTATITKI